MSDPSHRRYGQHLTADEVDELVKPTDETLEAVHSWLEENDIPRHRCGYSPAKDWINVNLDIATAGRLLDSNFSVFEHNDGTRFMRTLEWSLPKSLHSSISTIQPTNSFMRTRPHAVHVKPYKIGTANYQQSPPSHDPAANISAVCNVTGVTPTCLRTLYGTIDYTPQVPGKNRVGLNDFLGESNNRSDTSIFLNRYRPDAAPAAYQFQFVVINNGSDQQTPDNETQLENGVDEEGNLDVETILGISYPTPLTAFTTGGSPPFNPDVGTPTDTNEPYITWLQYVLAQPDDSLPQTISTSYGDDEQTVPQSYATAACRGFAQLGARGISLLFSSGDSGVGPDGACFSNDGKNTTKFIPEFPACNYDRISHAARFTDSLQACPYVTAVGATRNFTPEVAAFDTFRDGSVFTSGAGFSNYFARPSYQADAVNGYLSQIGSLNAGLYNTTGRAYPDIAAQGQRYITIWNGSVAILDGTSCSAPAATSVLSLVNDALIAAGKKPLGFLNPWLYKKGYKAFTDVLSGSSAGCDTDGFPAEKGWDAVTGFGTPNFEKLLAEVGLKGNGSGGYWRR